MTQLQNTNFNRLFKICERVENEPEKVGQVCGSDGNTYSNQCVFKHYKCVTGVVVQKVGDGACSGNETYLMDSINIAQIEKKVRKNKNPILLFEPLRVK